MGNDDIVRACGCEFDCDHVWCPRCQEWFRDTGDGPSCGCYNAGNPRFDHSGRPE